MRRRAVVAGPLSLLVVLLLAAPTALANGWDPAAIVSAYTAALTNGDVDSALALFDDNGSASDLAGRTYSGRDGLRAFLTSNGFGAHSGLSTDRLVVVANRAIWDYTCSCASRPTEVRIVLNDQDKISVFAMFPSHAPPARSGASLPVWLFGLPLMAAAAAGLGWRKRVSVPPSAPRAAQGRLIAALREAHARGGSGVLSEPATDLGRGA
jgi:hypothetical protein